MRSANRSQISGFDPKVTLVSAYIPAYNVAGSVGQAIESVRAQGSAVREVVVIDDGSTDGTAEAAERSGARVIRERRNRGRGWARSLAMEEAEADLVLMCDATIALLPGFLEAALPRFQNAQVAAVFGNIVAGVAQGTADRWRDRHLFKVDTPGILEHGASLATGGCVLRRPAVLEVGNFDRRLRHSEDADLGRRLLAAGYDVVRDPAIGVYPLVQNTTAQVLERYWRWYAGADEQFSARGYMRQVSYSIKVLAAQDLKRRDLPCAIISLMVPHYKLWRHLRQRR